MVFKSLSSFSNFLKTKINSVKIDNATFRLHYNFTTSFCFIACTLVAASDFIGGPIDCLNADRAINTFCWITSTYTLNTTHNKGESKYYASHGSSYSGIGTYNPNVHEKTYHAYYQWITYVLFFQGCLFYLPHLLWKTIEGEDLLNLLQGLNAVLSPDDKLVEKKANIIQYLRDSVGMNQKYVFGFVLCEFLNFVNTLLQLCFLDAFFGGMFWQLGSKVIFLPMQDDDSRIDPLIERFPRITKCDFLNYGPTGTLQNRDFICILPQNLLNEKIFLIMWIWLTFLLATTGCQLLVRFLMIQIPAIRVYFLERRGEVEKLDTQAALIRHLPLGDFFLLRNIQENVSAIIFKDILRGLRAPSSNPYFPRRSENSLNHPYDGSFINVGSVDSVMDLTSSDNEIDVARF